MTEKSRSRTNWRRLLIWIAGAGLLIFVALPTAYVLQTRFAISSALRSASTVILEDYAFGRTLTSSTQTPAEYRHVTEAMPITGKVDLPFSVALCFVPHHRVVITNDQQAETTLAVCFACDQIKLSKRGIANTPAAWREPLRQLFLRHDLPIRDNYRFDPQATEQQSNEADSIR